jgi:hypothetical protein
VSHDGPPLAVFDCLVFFRATTRPAGPAARLFIDYIEDGPLSLYVSDAIIEEVRAIPLRPTQGRDSYNMVEAFSVYDFLGFQMRNHADFRLPVLTMLRSITK